jgi:putative endonuclease
MREHHYYVYMVASRSRTLYIGITNNLHRRISEHRTGAYSGFTAAYRCHRLVWFEAYVTVTLAITREKQLKAWTRAKKIALIERDNPTWADLSWEWEPKAGPSTAEPPHQR